MTPTLHSSSPLPKTDSTGREPGAVIPWRMRPDLIIRLQDNGAWIVKDPLSLSYAMLSDSEMSLLRSLDGKQTVTRLLERLKTAWPEHDFTASDVIDFLRQLAANQLVAGSFPAPAPKSSKKTRGLSWLLITASQVLRIRIPLLNPASLLTKLEPLIQAAFSRTGLLLSAVLIGIALSLVTLRFGRVAESLPSAADFVQLDNLLLLLMTFVGVKALHELGHACAAKRFGAECNEAGILLLLMTPILYTNVTDSWILDRRRRLLITASGMFVEILLASFATLLWFFAAPGIVRTLLANIMVLCTVSTILFNGNPLLRYDGYFLLADALGLPNLAQQASARLQVSMENLLLGSEEFGSVQPNISSQTPLSHRLLLLYGALSITYRTLLSVGILFLLARLLDHWNLRIIGLGLMTLALVTLVMAPLMQTSSALFAAMLNRSQPSRSLIRTLVILAAMLSLLFVPFPQSIVVPAVVEPVGTPVFATLSGQLDSYVAYGQPVLAGESIATLTDIRLQRELIRLQAEARVQETRVRTLELSRDSANAAILPQAKKSLEAIRQRLNQFERETERLHIRARRNGVLLPPRSQSVANSDDEIAQWSQTPLLPCNVGATIAEGTLMGYIADVSQIDLLMCLTDRQRLQIQPSQTAVFIPTGNAGQQLTGLVGQIGSLEVPEVPAELIAAGLIAPQLRNTPKPFRWQATAQIVLPARSTPPPLYATGLVRVHIASASLATRLRQFLSEAFE